MIHRIRLFTPGPTPVPPFVREAMAASYDLHHRHDTFREIWERVTRRLPSVWGVPGPVVLLFGSGTSGMDAVVSNLFNPGERVLVGAIGKFGERWTAIARHRGLDVIEIRKPWGEALHPEDILPAIERDKTIRGVLFQACETSTGVENPVADLARALRDWDGFIVVDAITGLGSMALQPVSWGLDAVISASQKAWMLPPGLAMVWMSERAWERARGNEHRPYYLDLVAHRESQERGQSLFTPSIPLVVGLDAVVDYLEKRGGLVVLVENARRLAGRFREAIRPIPEWKLFPRERPAHALTAVALPEKVDGVQWVRYLREQYGIIVAGGQGHLKGRIFRVSHLGYLDMLDILGLVDILNDGWRQFLKATAQG